MKLNDKTIPIHLAHLTQFVMSKKRHGFRLHNIPSDIWEILLDKQLQIKKKCNCVIGIEHVIYKYIRANKDLPLE